MQNIAQKLRELYEQHPKARVKFNRKYHPVLYGEQVKEPSKLLVEMLGDIDEKPLQDLSLESLDTYEQDSSLSILLSLLPHNIVVEEFGLNVFQWACFRNSYSERDEMQRSMSQMMGIDENWIRKARASSWRLNSRVSDTYVQDCLGYLDLFKKVWGDFTATLDPEEMLQEYAHEGVTISEKRANDYDIIPLTTRGKNDAGEELTWGAWHDESARKFIRVYMDAPIGLGLLYKGQPNAVVGFMHRGRIKDGTPLVINQLQGVRPGITDKRGKLIKRQSSRGLYPIDWQRMMVDCVDRLAQDMGYQELVMMSGHFNPWITPKRENEDPHMELETALKKYDAVAERLGFEQRKDLNWYKRVKKVKSKVEAA